VALEDAFSPPTTTRGEPSSLLRCEVVTVNADGTVDVRDVASRATMPRLRAPRGYTLARRDKVLVGHLLGDRQSPAIVTVEA
jgi:hypothetical protein